MATYLTCPRKRGLQKKHIDICHRCDSNGSCEPYQEYFRDRPKTETHDAPPSDQGPLVSESLLKDIVKELNEIKILLADRERDDKSYPTEIVDFLTSKKISIALLKKELRTIKEM